MIFNFLITFFLILFNSTSFAEKIIEGKAKIIDGDTIHIEKNKSDKKIQQKVAVGGY